MHDAQRQGIYMTVAIRWIIASALAFWTGTHAIASESGKEREGRRGPTKAAAERMIGAAEGSLAPVYAPLAEEIAERLGLSGKQGIGIDLGSGPGTLILELCARTRMHWINADINPHFFPYFLARADVEGCRGRVSAIQADACALPFRDDFADVVVSRGSFQFWPDLTEGLREVHRVLKPGGVAYIGRGLPERMELETAKRFRDNAGEGPKYDPDETEQQLHRTVRTLGIENYRIHRPRLNNREGVNYGIWLEFHKPIP